MKKYGLIAIFLIVVMMIVGCSHNAEVSKNADESETVSFSADKTAMIILFQKMKAVQRF